MRKIKKLFSLGLSPLSRALPAFSGAFAAVALGVAASAAQAAEITVVKAEQRYPWNGKVDITYTVSELAAAAEAEGMSPFVTVLAIDRTTTPWKTNVADSACLFTGPCATNRLSDFEATADGTHQIVWDMDAQGLTFTSTNVVFAVLGDGGVQLWKDGPYWAKCNVGATKPEEYGYYFWWGDTVGYKRNAADNGWVSVKDGTSFLFSANYTTYCRSISQLKSDGYIDSTTNLVATHDAATARLGKPWRMPTDAEMQALIANCTTTWITTNGISGRLVTGKESFASKSIFLPAAGYGYGLDLGDPGSIGSYWSSTPNSGNSYYAWDLDFNSGDFGRYYYNRFCGQSVRPLRGFAK